MESVFVVQHLHIINDDEEDVKFIGVYRTLASANAAIDRLKIQPGFRDYPELVDYADDNSDYDPQGFHINEYQLDDDHWREGYFTAFPGENIFKES